MSGDRPRRAPGPRPHHAESPPKRPLPRMLAGLRGSDLDAEVVPRPAPPDAQFWIRKLRLRAHPEGGYYRETYRASEQLGRGQVPDRFDGPRAVSTAIYFLLEGQQRSLI